VNSVSDARSRARGCRPGVGLKDRLKPVAFPCQPIGLAAEDFVGEAPGHVQPREALLLFDDLCELALGLAV
jgi:hypothetical protein